MAAQACVLACPSCSTLARPRLYSIFSDPAAAQLSCKIPSPRIVSRSQGPSLLRSMAASLPARPPVKLDSKSECPPLFDGTTRLYYNSSSPFAQRVLVAVNYKGLADIELLEISLSDKPIWYKEKVYPVGKVPALEHNGKVTGESLDLLEYLDKHFGGPLLIPTEEAKKEAAAELLTYLDTFNKAGFTILRMKDPAPSEIDEAISPALDYIGNALGKYANEGPFSSASLVWCVDVAYAPFVERFEVFLSGIRNYDITVGRPNLTKWLKAVNKVEAYTNTKLDRSILLDEMKRLMVKFANA